MDEAAVSGPVARTAQSARDLRLRMARREVTERRRITQRLRHALTAGGFVLHYQPLVTLSSRRIRGAEVLIRLQHSRRGLIAANHFMPIAERSDVITDVGAWILQTACAEAADWPADASVAVALSLRHLQSGRFVRQLLEALGQSGLDPERLELELTEAMLIDDNDDTVFSLRALHGIGVRLALANFGAGYASLAAVRRLPLATLRLDRTLTQTLAEGETEATLVDAAVKAGHALGCAVLADGVESEQQFQLLAEIGCDEGQGAFFGPPVTAPEFLELLKRG